MKVRLGNVSGFQVLDAIALLLVVAGGAAFAAGSSALARAEDLKALYWLVVGIVAVRAAVHLARPRAV